MEITMSINHCNNDKIPTLSNTTVKEIEEVLGEEPVFVVAFGVNGKSVPIRPELVEGEILDLEKAPITTEQIFQIESFSLVGYKGSHICAWRHRGILYRFRHGH
jgi:hypothetical protein